MQTRRHIHFWIFFLDVNITFFLMHFLRLARMPCRIHDYPDPQNSTLCNGASQLLPHRILTRQGGSIRVVMSMKLPLVHHLTLCNPLKDNGRKMHRKGPFLAVPTALPTTCFQLCALHSCCVCHFVHIKALSHDSLEYCCQFGSVACICSHLAIEIPLLLWSIVERAVVILLRA